MFIDLGMRVALSDEQFVEEMADRVDKLGLGVNDHLVGCPLCMAMIPLIPPEEAEPEADTTAEVDSTGQP
jgi:hypothetical protein